MAFLKNKFNKLMLWAATIVVILSASDLVYILVVQPLINRKKLDDIRSIYYETEHSDTENLDIDDESSKVNRVLSLLDINKDIRGWIKINNTPIDYPVLKSAEDEPEFYLYRSYKKENTKYGSIFIDSKSRDGTDSKNILLHGHNMNDGSMFAGILKFTDINFYKLTPLISFDTIFESAKWKVVSVFRVNTLSEHGSVFNYLRSSFYNDEDFMDFVKEIRERSLINIPVDVNSEDRLLTLSTCSYEFKDFRTVVVARKVREDEDEWVDVDKAVVNPNPVLPECYYN